MKDHYKVLGVAPIDSKERILEVYKNLSKKYRGGIKAELKSTSEDMMKQIIAAYNVLNDDGKRKDYDIMPHFQVRKTSAKLMALSSKKEKEKLDDKKPFQWEIPLMDILLMPFRNPERQNKNQSPEEKAQMHFTLGVSMAEDKALFEQAKNEFSLALKFLPDFKEAVYNLGLMLYKLGKYSEATEHFKKVLTIDPRDPHAKKMVEILE